MTNLNSKISISELSEIEQNNTKMKVLFTMWNYWDKYQKDLTLSQLVKLCKMSRQKLKYHLEIMQNEGLVIFDEYHRSYSIQPALKHFDEGVDELIPLAKFLTEKIVIDNGIDINTCLQNVFLVFLQRITVEIHEI